MLHPYYDQVDTDHLTTALACMALASQVNSTMPMPFSPMPSSERLFWESEADRALMKAERDRCFDL